MIMGKFKSCAIGFRDKIEVYREGDLVAGVVLLDVLEAVTVKGVRIYCYGEALTKWTNYLNRDNDNIGQEKYFAQVVTLFGSKHDGSEPQVELEARQHRWSFSFRLPSDHLPSSYEGEYGAIRWWLMIEVAKPFPSVNNKWYRTFTVLGRLDINEALFKDPAANSCEMTLSNPLGIGNTGQLILSASADRYGYCAGESIALKVIVKNQSSRDLGKISVSLEQWVTFIASGNTSVTKCGLTKQEADILPRPGDAATLVDLLLTIPAVPPSTSQGTCHIITVTYLIKVTVSAPRGINLETTIPIVIGTVPLNKPAIVTGSDETENKLDARPSITYKKCVLGFTPFSRGYGHFPNYPCTLQCPYVNDEVLKSVSSTVTTTHIPSGVLNIPIAVVKSQTSDRKAVAQNKVVAIESEARRLTEPPVYSFVPPVVENSSPKEILESPPSYDDVLRMVRTEQKASANEQAVITASQATGQSCALLLLRFPDKFLDDFRACIKHEQSNLADAEGQITALSPQPLQFSDAWPSRTSIAILVFPEVQNGKDWFISLQERGEKWLDGCEAVITPGLWYGPQNQQVFFSLSVVSTREGVDQKDVHRYTIEFAPMMTEIRYHSISVHSWKDE